MASQTAETGSLLSETVVVDTDVHLSYNENLRRKIARRMSEPYRGRTDPDTPGDPYPDPGLPRSLGGRKSFCVSDASSPAVIQEELVEAKHIDYPIINNIAPGDRIFNTARALEETRAANDVLLEEFLDPNDHFYGLASVATRDPAAAAEEIDRLAGEDRIVGVYLGMGSEFQEKPLGDPRYDVMYAAMEDHDLTPVFHVSDYPEPATAIRGVETNYARIAIGPVWCSMLTLASLIAQGTPEKFPDLDFLFLEAGLAYVPMMMARLNRRHGEFQQEVPLLEKSPEEYIRESFYFGSQPIDEFNDYQHLNNVIETIGPESITFASDFPHHDFDHPRALDGFLDHFSAEEREDVLHGNAIDLFDLDL